MRPVFLTFPLGLLAISLLIGAGLKDGRTQRWTGISHDTLPVAVATAEPVAGPQDPLIAPLGSARPLRTTHLARPATRLDLHQIGSTTSQPVRWPFSEYVHDRRAIFEPHGHKVCASGCAASRHPTNTLTENRFKELLRQYAREPASQESQALEALLFFGRQTRQLARMHGLESLDTERREFLRSELQRDHAQVSIRLVDERGVTRSWIDDAVVPLDRRHVFVMETNGLQPLVTSGTVKRVGVDHWWTRL